MSFFSEEIINELREPLAKEAVKTREGTGGQKLSYIASHHAINQANNLFGFGQWSTEIQHIQMVDKTEYEKPPYNPTDKPKKMVSVSYTCQLRLIVKSVDETESVAENNYEDIGFGNGVAGNTAYGLASVIELASKEAVTDALKRCLRYYGNQFGLSLYDKDAEALMSAADIENTKPVTPDQLEKLRELYEPRGIDDDWVIAALAGEDHSVKSLSELNQDWYHHAVTIAYNYNLKEVEAEKYKDEVKKAIDLMKQSVNMNMLKALFKEAWTKASNQEDNELKKEAQDVYNEKKEELEK